jgi:hypothetical protein
VTRLHGTTRLLTLTGTGGCGKSRLALGHVRNILNNLGVSSRTQRCGAVERGMGTAAVDRPND